MIVLNHHCVAAEDLRDGDRSLKTQWLPGSRNIMTYGRRVKARLTFARS
jgi:hypothetical protein